MIIRSVLMNFCVIYRPYLISIPKLAINYTTILIILKQLSFIFIILTAVMNSNNIINHNKDRTKSTAAIPMVGAIVTVALLLSGLSLISSSELPACNSTTTRYDNRWWGWGWWRNDQRRH